MTLPYPDPRVAIATLHGKAGALAPALATLGLRIETVPIDTDALGTFAGDIERPGTSHEVVVEKARRGMAASGIRLGIATEGSFGPDPVLGFLPLHVELLAFVDDVHGQTIVIEHAGHETNWVSKPVRPGQNLDALLAEIGVPVDAALVKPNRWAPAGPGIASPAPMPMAKGLRAAPEIETAIERIAVASEDGLARLEADLRAHVNRRRLAVIARLGERLAARLATPCPACAVPGFGVIATEAGLPCELCGTPTELVRVEIHGCGACGHRITRSRADGRVVADGGHCPECNP